MPIDATRCRYCGTEEVGEDPQKLIFNIGAALVGIIIVISLVWTFLSNILSVGVIVDWGFGRYAANIGHFHTDQYLVATRRLDVYEAPIDPRTLDTVSPAFTIEKGQVVESQTAVYEEVYSWEGVYVVGSDNGNEMRGYIHSQENSGVLRDWTDEEETKFDGELYKKVRADVKAANLEFTSTNDDFEIRKLTNEPYNLEKLSYYYLESGKRDICSESVCDQIKQIYERYFDNKAYQARLLSYP